MNQRKKIILNCDPGTDDSLCIIMGLMHPEIELLAVTAESGNLTSDKTSRNALQIMELMGRSDVPVARGMLHPLVRPHPSDPYSHGEDGLGNHFFPEPSLRIADKHAALVIIDEVMKYPGEVTIVCTAPLTNVALAFMLKPEIIPMVKEIYHLGGAYGVTDYAFSNATGDNPMSEWNIYVDPEAAEIVYGSGAMLTTIGLDVAFNPEWVSILPETLEKLRRTDSVSARYALEIIDYIDQNNSLPDLFNNGPIDTVAMCSVICPEIIETREISVAIDTSDNQLTQGMTIWDHRNHLQWEQLNRIRTACAIDSARYNRVFFEAVTGLPYDEVRHG
ncbi:MAG: nucleoside hydrolase [Oscillospiraceae bacterium]|nr:nucleoside hydrolase [Oscillospiraceae bacterium]